MPAASFCRRARWQSDAARKRPYSNFVGPSPPEKSIDRLASRMTVTRVLV
jgi:hypothetical protein